MAMWSQSAALIVCEALILRRRIKMTREHAERKKKKKGKKKWICIVFVSCYFF